VIDNEIDGEGTYGFYVETDGNLFKDNDLENLTSAYTDYYLDEGVTNNILYLDEDDSYIDDSGNDTNRIIRDD